MTEKMVKVRIHLSAITRLEYTFEKEVPESIANDHNALDKLANDEYADADGNAFEEDVEYFEQGHCWAEAVK